MSDKRWDETLIGTVVVSFPLDQIVRLYCGNATSVRTIVAIAWGKVTASYAADFREPHETFKLEAIGNQDIIVGVLAD